MKLSIIIVAIICSLNTATSAELRGFDSKIDLSDRQPDGEGDRALKSSKKGGNVVGEGRSLKANKKDKAH